MIDDIYNKWYYSFSRYAGVAELADAPDLGSGALRRGGSSPFSRTNYICTCRCFFFCPFISVQGNRCFFVLEPFFLHIRKYAIINYQYYCISIAIDHTKILIIGIAVPTVIDDIQYVVISIVIVCSSTCNRYV